MGIAENSDGSGEAVDAKATVDLRESGLRGTAEHVARGEETDDGEDEEDGEQKAGDTQGKRDFATAGGGGLGVSGVFAEGAAVAMRAREEAGLGVGLLEVRGAHASEDSLNREGVVCFGA